MLVGRPRREGQLWLAVRVVPNEELGEFSYVFEAARAKRTLIVSRLCPALRPARGPANSSEDFLRRHPVSGLLSGEAPFHEGSLRSPRLCVSCHCRFDEVGDGLALFEQRLDSFAEGDGDASRRQERGLHVRSGLRGASRFEAQALELAVQRAAVDAQLLGRLGHVLRRVNDVEQVLHLVIHATR